MILKTEDIYLEEIYNRDNTDESWPSCIDPNPSPWPMSLSQTLQLLPMF